MFLLYPNVIPGRGWYFTTFFVARFSMQKDIAPNRIYGFVKTRGQKDLSSMKKGVNQIKNQDYLYKMLKSGERLDQV